MKSKLANKNKSFNEKNKNVNQKKNIKSKCDKSNQINIVPFKNINTIENDYISHFDFVHTYNDLYYVIYTNSKHEIIFIDIIDNKIVLKIKNSYDHPIDHFACYSDKNNKMDLFAFYCNSCSIKLWNINTMECIAVIDVKKALGSLFFMNFKNQLYIVAHFAFDDKIVLYDLKGIKVKEIKIKNKNNRINDTNYYYEQKTQKYYFFFGGFGFLKSFDVNKNDVYKIYCDNDGIGNKQVKIYDDNKIIKLISTGDGMVRIWNFHSGVLLNKIKINNQGHDTPKICIWNNEYLIGAYENYGLKILDFKHENYQNISGFGDTEEAKKIIHPVYGECLLILTYHGTSRLTPYLCLGINKSI